MDFSNNDITMCNNFLIDDFNPLYNKEWSPTFQNKSQIKNDITSSAGPVILQIPRSNGFKDNDFLLSPMETSPNSDKICNGDFQNILQDAFISMETETSDHKLPTTQHQYQKDINELNRCFNSKKTTGSNAIDDLTKDLIFIDPPVLSTEEFSYFIVVQQSSVLNCDHVFEDKRRSRKCLFQPQTSCKDKESDFFECFRPV